MRIVRGTVPDVADDRAVTRELGEYVSATGEPALRAWTPPRQVAFGRRDVAADGYDRARETARTHGFEPVERDVGGRAVAYAGDTVAFVNGVPLEGDTGGIRSRYQSATEILERAFRSLGVTVRRCEPDGAFCPGDHSLRHDGKVAGVAQRVRRESALVGGCVVVTERDADEMATVLEPVYEALEVPFDPAATGSLQAAGGPATPEPVVDAVVDAVVGDRDATVVAASDRLD